MPNAFAVRTPPGATAAAILAAVVAFLAGCGPEKRPPTPAEAPAPIRDEAPPPHQAADEALTGHARDLGRVGLFLALAAAATWIAAFIPIVGRFIPAKLAGACAAAAAALWAVEYWLIAYGHLAAAVALWLTLAAGAVAAVPLGVAAYRWYLTRQGHALIRAGHIRDGVALTAAGDSRVNRQRRAAAVALRADGRADWLRLPRPPKESRP